MQREGAFLPLCKGKCCSWESSGGLCHARFTELQSLTQCCLLH